MPASPVDTSRTRAGAACAGEPRREPSARPDRADDPRAPRRSGSATADRNRPRHELMEVDRVGGRTARWRGAALRGGRSRTRTRSASGRRRRPAGRASRSRRARIRLRVVADVFRDHVETVQRRCPLARDRGLGAVVPLRDEGRGVCRRGGGDGGRIGHAGSSRRHWSSATGCEWTRGRTRRSLLAGRRGSDGTGSIVSPRSRAASRRAGHGSRSRPRERALDRQDAEAHIAGSGRIRHRDEARKRHELGALRKSRSHAAALCAPRVRGSRP